MPEAESSQYGPTEVLRWVGQDDPEGCGVAVLSMLTGEPYVTVRAAIEARPFYKHGGDWREHGVNGIIMEHYLAERGWFFRRVYVSWEFGTWPPPPFAERHFAQVGQPSGNGHYVVMDAKGCVLDPLREGTFALSDWEVVNHVIGLKR